MNAAAFEPADASGAGRDLPSGWAAVRRPGSAPEPGAPSGPGASSGPGTSSGPTAASGSGRGAGAGPFAFAGAEAPVIERPLPVEPASIDGMPLQGENEAPDAQTLRQRACTELLRRAAQRAGLLAADDEPSWDRDGGVVSEAASAAIEALLERELAIPEPSEEACRRHYAARLAVYSTGERVRARHILFAVTPGVDVAALRRNAEAALLDVRARDRSGVDEDDVFARAARNLSNCPSGQAGGELGWLGREDCAPEFARELFGHAEVGVLPRLVHSRFGLHVVEVLERRPGQPRPYEEVREAVALSLKQQAYVTALRQYLSLLAGAADVRGIDLEAADTPLVR